MAPMAAHSLLRAVLPITVVCVLFFTICSSDALVPAQPAAEAAGAPASCVSVADFGALGDGVTDDTAAFRAAVAAAGVHGGCVLVPGAKLGAGFVLTGTVAVPMGVSLIGATSGWVTAPWASGPPGDVSTTGGSRILARPPRQRESRRRTATTASDGGDDGGGEDGSGTPLFTLQAGCSVRGLYVLYDTMPLPTDEDFLHNASSPFFYPSFEAARDRFLEDHVYSRGVGPTFLVTAGRRVLIEDVVGFGFVDFVYFTGSGHGQSAVRSVHGWGFGRLVTVEQAADVMTFSGLRYIVNSGPGALGHWPGATVCAPGQPAASSVICRGNFTVLPAIIVLSPRNVGLWLGRWVLYLHLSAVLILRLLLQYRTYAWVVIHLFVHVHQLLLEQTMDVYDSSTPFILQSCCSNNCCRVSRMYMYMSSSAKRNTVPCGDDKFLAFVLAVAA